MENRSRSAKQAGGRREILSKLGPLKRLEEDPLRSKGKLGDSISKVWGYVKKLSLGRESHPSSVSHKSEVMELSSEGVENDTDSCFGGEPTFSRGPLEIAMTAGMTYSSAVAGIDGALEVVRGGASSMTVGRSRCSARCEKGIVSLEWKAVVRNSLTWNHHRVGPISYGCSGILHGRQGGFVNCGNLDIGRVFVR